jgi:phosphatidylinositol alpha-1,6-mannosyltransferase
VIAPNFLYQNAWLPFIRRADLVLVNSRNTRRLAMERGIPAEAIEILHPGTDLVRPGPQEGARLRAAHQWGDRPVLLSVGRLTPRKGLVEFILRAFPKVLASHPDALLVVFGGDAIDAVRPAVDSELARITRSAERAGVADSVRLLPHCDQATLHAAYCAADVYIFPVLDLPGDVEGFGMVAVEAAARGLPTVGFKAGGVPDAVLEGITGSLADVGNYDELALLVGQWLGQRRDLHARTRCADAASVFGWHRFSEALHAALDRQTGSNG